MGDIAMTTAKPAMRPARPEFSSGPCAKRPGWSPENLSSAVLGRSHRSKLGKARLKEAIDRTREVLEVPEVIDRLRRYPVLLPQPSPETRVLYVGFLHPVAAGELPRGES